MTLPTNIEPANRGTLFGQVPNGIRATWMEPIVESPTIGERWLVVVGSQDAESQCLSFVRRIAKGDAEIHLAKPSGPDSAMEVRRLVIALEGDGLCMVAPRGTGLMSRFLRGDVARIPRAAPCPVICIPAHGELSKSQHTVLNQAQRRHRRGDWHTPSRRSLSPRPGQFQSAKTLVPRGTSLLLPPPT